MYEWECGTMHCDGVVRTEAKRPVDGEIVECEQRLGHPYASSCHHEMRFDRGKGQFLPSPGTAGDAESGGPISSMTPPLREHKPQRVGSLRAEDEPVAPK